MKKFLFVQIVFLFLFVKAMNAQEGLQTKNAFLERCTILLDNGGAWEAVNPDFDSTKEWSASHYGYKFEKGYHENILKIKINGLVKGKRYLYWDGYYYWNPVKQRAEYFSLGTSGSVARGEMIGTSNQLYFTIVNPDGSESVHLDTEIKVSHNEFHSQSYKLEKDGWKKNNFLVWKRIIDKN